MKKILPIIILSMLSFVAYAQSKVTGVVTDESGEPLVGAFVV